MTNLHAAPLAQTLAPLLCTVKAAMDSFDRQVESLGPLPAGNMALSDLERGRSLGDGVGNTFSCPTPFEGLYGPKCQPPDLAAFLRTISTREGASVLGVGHGTVTRLKQGYWPADNRKIVRAWDAYKGRSVQRATSWFVRRVSPDGVRHGGKLYQASQLAGRAGELLAVARAADGGLLAQALELPVERFTLAVKG